MAELKSNEWTPPFESHQSTVRLKNGKVRIIRHTRALSDVRHIPVTRELNLKYLQMLAEKLPRG
jgi:hypothetical protein